MRDMLIFFAQAFVILSIIGVIGYVVTRIAARFGIKVNDE